MRRIPALLLFSVLTWMPGGVASAAPDAETADTGALTAVLEPLTGDRLFRDAEIAVQVVDVKTGEQVWARDADAGLNPASTTKILTAATALKTLGPSYSFTTIVYGATEPDGAGVIDGPLYVKGGGDPTLVVEKLWKLVRDLELAGVTKVDGDLVLDESFFGDDHRLVGWDKRRDIERGPSYFPALSALSLNFNTIAIVVRPGAESGKPAIVLPETEADGYVTIDNQMTTTRAGTRPRVQMEREVAKDGTVSFLMEGSVPVGDRVRRYYRTVADPTAYFGAAFRAICADRGIEVTGRTRTGVVPDSAEPLVSLSSPPLTNILMDMNKYSSNFMAEQVLRTVGAETKGVGTTAAGIEVMREYLEGLGLDPKSYQLINGSGLTRDAVIPPSVLTAVLVDMAHDEQVGHEFTTSLSIAGRDGTLRRRLEDEAGRLRGKTGTLDGVHCLAGYVESGDGGRYAFAFLANDFRGGSYRVKKVHDRFARMMFGVTTDAAASGGDQASPDDAGTNP
jgi:D-alanyl-D-alanine carboxypeptidase/D-alanyl-D-alanine-endopeptidase (penicillin-binding protein 4)